MKKFTLQVFFAVLVIMFSCQKQDITDNFDLSPTQDETSLSTNHQENRVVKI